MAFYTYSQNNSGGRFGGPALYVIVEANSPSEADSIAEMEGLYFNGCEDGMDCPCCGDRWYPASDYDASEQPEIYGQRIPDGQAEDMRTMMGWDQEAGGYAKVIYLNGDVKTY